MSPRCGSTSRTRATPRPCGPVPHRRPAQVPTHVVRSAPCARWYGSNGLKSRIRTIRLTSVGETTPITRPVSSSTAARPSTAGHALQQAQHRLVGPGGGQLVQRAGDVGEAGARAPLDRDGADAVERGHTGQSPVQVGERIGREPIDLERIDRRPDIPKRIISGRTARETSAVIVMGASAIKTTMPPIRFVAGRAVAWQRKSVSAAWIRPEAHPPDRPRRLATRTRYTTP